MDEYPKWVLGWIVNDAETEAKLLAGTHRPMPNPISAQGSDPVVHGLIEIVTPTRPPDDPSAADATPPTRRGGHRPRTPSPE